jgi:hypothetical protein
MRYTKYKHNPILGKAGDIVDILKLVPADTEIILDKGICYAGLPLSVLDISLRSYDPIEHTITLNNDGTIGNILNVHVDVEWNRAENAAETGILECTFCALERIFHSYGDGYDTRRLPKPDALARTAANNPHAFLDVLNQFQKTYRNKQEKKQKKEAE